MKFLCRIGFHAWSVWSEPKHGVAETQWIWSDKVNEEPITVQERTCLHCKKHDSVLNRL